MEVHMRSKSLVLVISLLTLTGCSPPSTPVASFGDLPSATGTSSVPVAPSGPAGVDLDTAATTALTIGADGGHATVTTGTWTAMVVVPAGSASAGSSWTVTPLRTAPAGVADALSPGLYVDDAGQPPTGDCLIGFSTPGTADPDATIVKLAIDGASSELVATYRKDTKGATLLVARVGGFSTYGVGKGTKAARDAAKKKQSKQQGHYSISVHDKVSFTKDGWRFSFTLDLNLAGGGTSSGGNYKGKATLLFTGRYKETLGGIITALGNPDWEGRGSATALLFGELGALTDLKNGLPYEMDDISGTGSATLKGTGRFKASASGPIGSMSTGKQIKNGVELPYLINVDGDKVTVEVANVGEFSGHLVRFP
jgi:hypothetical protein